MIRMRLLHVILYIKQIDLLDECLIVFEMKLNATMLRDSL